MDQQIISSANVSNSSQKRPANETAEQSRGKRAKYTSAACNECKRSKVKCIRMEDDADCQRCSTMKITCIVVPSAAQTAKESNKEKQRTTREGSHYQQLSEDMHSLRQQLTALTASVATLVEHQAKKSSPATIVTPLPSLSSPTVTSSSNQRTTAPQQPQFVGPTRSDFSFNIAETSLSRMGLPNNEPVSTGPPSVASSPEAMPADGVATPPDQSHDTGILLSYSTNEIVRLLEIYDEEIACVHPIVEVKDLIRDAPEILRFMSLSDPENSTFTAVGWKDVHILKVAIATSLIHEHHGKNKVSDRLVESVERNVGVISLVSEVELKDIRIMGMLSLYFCHTAEELFSWRAIGRAARQCLEIGLHRRQSLVDNFKDPKQRDAAVQVFWVVYELDRRYSFGTSLSFSLNDRDIDPQLPEPGKDHPYLKSMVAYARLCSRVWDALPPYGSSLQLIPKETEDYLDFITQNWLESVPQGLQFKHPRLEVVPKSQPRQLHRMRTLLYLRGNHVRTLIHRHHVLTPENIRADVKGAKLAVDIAKDCIYVLVHLNESSDIYIREQSIYHYYLLSALAVLLLAVCHSPQYFAEACRDSFVSAVELVKGFSRHSTASHRLWKSIRGLLPIVKQLGNRSRGVSKEPTVTSSVGQPMVDPTQERGSLQHESVIVNQAEPSANDTTISHSNFNNSMPDIFDMSNDLLDLYDVFGSAATDYPGPPIDNFGEQGLSTWEISEISRHFQGLI